jgi:hypothetical protein
VVYGGDFWTIEGTHSSFSTGDFINLDEEIDPEEREFDLEAEPEMPPAHFAIRGRFGVMGNAS